MKMSLCLRKRLYIVLLFCMVLSPAAPLCAQRLSESLASPLAQDVLLYAQNMPYGLVQNLNFYPVMANRPLMQPHEIQQAFAPQDLMERAARFALFKDLQFTNNLGAPSVVSAIGKTKTQAGALALQNLLALPNTDWDLAKRRQAFIKNLVESPELLAKLQQTLEILRDTENRCVAEFTPPNLDVEAQKSAASKIMYAQFQLMILMLAGIPEYKKMLGLRSLVGGQAALATLYSYNNYLAPKIAKMSLPSNFVNIVLRLSFAVLPLYISKLATWDLFYKKQGLLYSLAQHAFVNDPSQLPSANQPSKRARSLLALYALGAAAGLCYLFVSGYKDSKKEFAAMNGLAQFISASKELRETILSNSETSQAYAGAFGDMSKNWGELEKRAEGHKASSGPNLLCTNNSNINNMLALIKQTSADISRTVQFYGEIDAYVAMAQFVVGHQATQNIVGEPVRVCYSEFIENADESILDVQGVWHPLIPYEHVRTNTIKLGGGLETPRNGIVTGPNAAGKSVNLKALLVNILIAQTFGIACAESFTLTPFTKIIGRLNSPDDTARGLSKFQLEAEDVVRMFVQLRNLKENEHAFVVTDELFSGTEVGPAIELSKRLCDRVGRMKRVIYLLATHYKPLTALAGNSFKNYKVSVSKNVDGSLSYPFKLSPGIGGTNVAFDIFLQQLERQGLVDEDLKSMIIEARTAQEAQEAL